MKSILNLPPILQEVWRDVYASVIAGIVSSPHGDTVTDDKAEYAEEEAWEAVRRANGGEVTEMRQCDTSEARLAVIMDAIEQPCPVTGEPFFMVLKHPDLGWVPTYGGPFDSYTAPEKDEDGELSRWRYDHDAGCWTEVESMCQRVVDSDAEKPEPTFDDMVEALAPIVAEAHYGAEWANIKGDPPRLEAVLNNARLGVDNPKSLYVSNGLSRCASIALASWKAARAWGKK